MRIGSVEIHYEVRGAGEPLVLIHGLSGSTRWWGKNIDVLAEHYCVYTVDLMGFGRSRSQRFVLHESAHLLIKWMDRLGIDRASLMGHSMGGYIAAHIAATIPARIRRLVLVDAAVFTMDYRTYPQFAAGVLRGLMILPVDFLPVLVTDALRAGPLTILKAARELLGAEPHHQLPALDTPTLVVWGDQDSVVPTTMGATLCKTLSNAQFALIPNAGHVPMWDQPEQFNRLVLDFLLAEEGTSQAAEPAERSTIRA